MLYSTFWGDMGGSGRQCGGAGSILGGWGTGSRTSDKAGPRWRGRSSEGTAHGRLSRPLNPVLGTEGRQMSH